MKRQRSLKNLSILLILNLSLCTATNTDLLQGTLHEEKVITDNQSYNIASRANGQIRFEDLSNTDDADYNLESSNNGFKFEDDGRDQRPNNSGRISFQDNEEENIGSHTQYFPEDGVTGPEITNPVRVTFQDENSINSIENSGTKKKKRRRRRRPRYQRPQVPVGPFPGPQNSLAPFPNPQQPVPLGPPYSLPTGTVPPYPGFGPAGYPPGQYYRPSRRPKPSFASEALATVTGALTSIAMYDDYQCVPRLLCEAAGGGALGSSGVLQSIAGLQPLLTLLSAYNGISSSPLFVFGRAVFLGMTSKTNTASCRYAYPQCPTDPEQLVHYLNNHNGGFFRFFNSPTQQNPQNLNQFYQQLTTQGQYGLQSPQQNLFSDPLNPQNPNQFYQQQNYGLYEPQPNQPSYGLQQFQNVNQNLPQYGVYGPQSNQFLEQNQQSYGLQNSQYQNPGSLYNNPNVGYNYLQNYGKKYPYNKKYGLQNVEFKGNYEKSVDSKIQRRIENKPINDYFDSDIENTGSNQELKFPEDSSRKEDNIINIRDDRVLKFPEGSYSLNNGNVKAITFPQSVNQNLQGSLENSRTLQHLGFPNFNLLYSLYNYIRQYISNDGHVANHNNNNNINNNNNAVNINNNNNHNFNNDEEGVQTVYVIRGNGDPNHPEIIKLRPGEKLNL
ncbi:hypothetical protein evm_008786 [Chilo suppressalis]|nr:hypothetical protein evm_008786 [Chilo suppressalis]